MKLKLERGKPIDGSLVYHCQAGTFLWDKAGDEVEVPDEVAASLLISHKEYFGKYPIVEKKVITKAPEVKNAIKA